MHAVSNSKLASLAIWQCTCMSNGATAYIYISQEWNETVSLAQPINAKLLLPTVFHLRMYMYTLHVLTIHLYM